MRSNLNGRWLVGLLAVGVGLSCSTSNTSPSDAGTGNDAGSMDAGSHTGTDDGGLDSGIADAGQDAGIDAGVADAGGDAGVVDAGHGGLDSGVVDAGPDGGCPYKFCENFDEYDAGALVDGKHLGPWLIGFREPPAVDTFTIAPGGFRGSQALRVDIPYEISDADAGLGTPQVNAYLIQWVDAGSLVGGPDFYGRAEILFASDNNDAGLAIGVHSWWFSATGPALDGYGTNFNMGGTTGGTFDLGYWYPHWPDGGTEFPGEDAAGAADPLAVGTWHCVQWQYSGMPNNFGNVWIDGMSAISVNDPSPAKSWVVSDSYDTFNIGLSTRQFTKNAIDFYLDDFALDNQMIPCP